MYFTRKYRNIISQNLLVTNTCSIHWSNRNDFNYCLNSIGLEQYLTIQSQFFYLLLITRAVPFLARKYSSRKKFQFNATYNATSKIAVYLSQINLAPTLHYFMSYLMKEQLPPEQASIKIEGKFTKIIVWNAPLDEQTNCLLTTVTSFINDIPLYLKFITKGNLKQELAFWVFFHHFLRLKDNFPITEFGMKKYKYLDTETFQTYYNI